MKPESKCQETTLMRHETDPLDKQKLNFLNENKQRNNIFDVLWNSIHPLYNGKWINWILEIKNEKNNGNEINMFYEILSIIISIPFQNVPGLVYHVV